MKNDTVHIVGGGLVGALTTIFLAQRKFDVTLVERRLDMRRGESEAGRSINLAVTARGLKALGEVGLKEEVLKLATPMKGRILHDHEGGTIFVPYGQTEDEVINSVSRSELNKLLLTKAGQYDNVEMLFNQRLTRCDLERNSFTFIDEAGAGEKTVQADVAIATDGVWSVARKAMLENVMNFSYSQTFEAYGYKELVIPAAPGGGFQIEENALHIWPRKSFMLIALPNLEGSFTCTLFLAYKGKESFEQLQTEADVEAFFSREFPDAMKLMPTLTEDFFCNPTGALATIRCAPWHVKDKLMLLGDAAHGIVPFFGQGMNLGFEGCSLLGELLDNEAVADWQTLFEKIEAGHKPNADAIATMAVENFVEMSDTVANPKFQLKKHIGFELEKRYPGQFIPAYAMVVFHPEISYAEARRRGIEQDKLLEALAAGIGDVSQVDWEKAEQLMQSAKAA